MENCPGECVPGLPGAPLTFLRPRPRENQTCTQDRMPFKDRDWEEAGLRVGVGQVLSVAALVGGTYRRLILTFPPLP